MLGVAVPHTINTRDFCPSVISWLKIQNSITIFCGDLFGISKFVSTFYILYCCIALSIVRFYTLINHCCFGTSTLSPWAKTTFLHMYFSQSVMEEEHPKGPSWETFLHALSQLLSKLDSAYFTKMDTEVILNTIPDKACTTFLAHPEEAANRVQQCVSSDEIPTGPEVRSKMHLQDNLPCFDQKGQQAVTRLSSRCPQPHVRGSKSNCRCE